MQIKLPSNSFVLESARQKTVDVKKASNGRAAQYAYDTGTQFLDKYGNTKSAESFLSGDAVELQIEERDQRLTAVQLTLPPLKQSYASRTPAQEAQSNRPVCRL